MSERRRSLSTWGAAGVLTPVLYVLSLGPVIWLQNHGYIDATFLEVLRYFYAPLAFVAGKSTVVHDGIDWYVDFWGEFPR